MATIKKAGQAAAKAPARKAAAKTPRAAGSKVIQANTEVALFFDLKKLDESQAKKLMRFAADMGLVVSKIRDGGPNPPPPPPGPLSPAKPAKPARKKPAKKPPQP